MPWKISSVHGDEKPLSLPLVVGRCSAVEMRQQKSQHFFEGDCVCTIAHKYISRAHLRICLSTEGGRGDEDLMTTAQLDTNASADMKINYCNNSDKKTSPPPPRLVIRQIGKNPSFWGEKSIVLHAGTELVISPVDIIATPPAGASFGGTFTPGTVVGTSFICFPRELNLPKIVISYVQDEEMTPPPPLSSSSAPFSAANTHVNTCGSSSSGGAAAGLGAGYGGASCASAANAASANAPLSTTLPLVKADTLVLSIGNGNDDDDEDDAKAGSATNPFFSAVSAFSIGGDGGGGGRSSVLDLLTASKQATLFAASSSASSGLGNKPNATADVEAAGLPFFPSLSPSSAGPLLPSPSQTLAGPSSSVLMDLTIGRSGWGVGGAAAAKALPPSTVAPPTPTPTPVAVAATTKVVRQPTSPTTTAPPPSQSSDSGRGGGAASSPSSYSSYMCAAAPAPAPIAAPLQHCDTLLTGFTVLPHTDSNATTTPLTTTTTTAAAADATRGGNGSDINTNTNNNNNTTGSVYKMGFWEWKAHLDADDAAPNSWKRYTKAVADRLEAAYRSSAMQTVVHIDNVYAVCFNDKKAGMVQYRIDDPSRWRPVRRRGGDFVDRKGAKRVSVLCDSGDDSDDSGEDLYAAAKKNVAKKVVNKKKNKKNKNNGSECDSGSEDDDYVNDGWLVGDDEDCDDLDVSSSSDSDSDEWNGDSSLASLTASSSDAEEKRRKKKKNKAEKKKKN